MLQPLSAWLKGNHPIPPRFYERGTIDNPNLDWLTWLSIEESKPLHKVNEMNWLGLKEARLVTQEYLDKSSEIICGLEGGWLDGEERIMIQEELGSPPIPSLPIYLITTIDNKCEELVYVGKTKNSSRFSGGHSAALKLHDPKYNKKKKVVYRATVWFYFNEEYISLDWIQPESLALDLLDNIESQLIYHFQPELNTDKKKRNCATWNFSVHIQNFLKRDFLNDVFF